MFAMRALMRGVIDEDGGHLERWAASSAVRCRLPAKGRVVMQQPYLAARVQLLAALSRPELGRHERDVVRVVIPCARLAPAASTKLWDDF
jgi:hypothetical protein